MPGTNDFLPFAAAGGANVVSQSTYASLAALGPGFQTGIAESNQLNKVWRQSSIMAAVLGTMIADVTGQNAVDDGTTATLSGNLLMTMLGAGFQTDTSGAANSYTLTYTPAMAQPLLDGAVYSFRVLHTNTTASTLSINGSAAHAILNQTRSALTGGELVVGGPITVIYSVTLNSFVIQSNSGGIQHSVTPTAADNTTKVATTAFVTAAVAANTGPLKFILKCNSSGGIVHQSGPITVTGVVHASTGIYNVTFGAVTVGYAAITSVDAGGGGGFVSNVSNLTGTTLTVTTFNSASAGAADVAFSLAVYY